MSLAAATAVGTERPLRMRMRSDLIVAEQTVQGRLCRMLKDPVSLKYFRFEEEEYFLLSQLDGLSTATEIRWRPWAIPRR